MDSSGSTSELSLRRLDTTSQAASGSVTGRGREGSQWCSGCPAVAAVDCYCDRGNSPFSTSFFAVHSISQQTFFRVQPGQSRIHPHTASTLAWLPPRLSNFLISLRLSPGQGTLIFLLLLSRYLQSRPRQPTTDTHSHYCRRSSCSSILERASYSFSSSLYHNRNHHHGIILLVAYRTHPPSHLYSIQTARHSLHRQAIYLNHSHQ